MLLVKTYVAPSPISGLGLFAAEPIRKHTLIWKLSDLDVVIHQRDLDAMQLEPIQLQYVETYSYKNGNTYYLCIDDAKYMNHANDPNTYEVGQSSIASRDIQVGEELTCNYGQFDDSKRDLPYCQPKQE